MLNRDDDVQNTARRQSRRKSVIVTGGAGFLGSRLCQRLVEKGDEVLCVDNLLSGRMKNIGPLLLRPNFIFLKHDVSEPLKVEGPVDEIYNLACAASPPVYQRDPIHTFKTAVIGAINMLDLAEAKGARILEASTSEIYGDPKESPQSESYRGPVNTQGPRSCYDEGKRAAETLFHDYHERRGVQTRIARIFNTYGPNMNPEDGRVVSNFIVQALSKEDLTVYGDGRQTRSFCYLDDQINGLMLLMAAAPGLSEPINIGNPEEHSVLELVRMVLEKTGSSSQFVFRPLPVDDPHQRQPDISHARQYLGWEPIVRLSEGLDRTVAYFREELGLVEAPLVEKELA